MLRGVFEVIVETWVMKGRVSRLSSRLMSLGRSVLSETDMGIAWTSCSFRGVIEMNLKEYSSELDLASASRV